MKDDRHAMTVGELREKLAAFPDDHFLVLEVLQCGPVAFSPLWKLKPGYADTHMKNEPYFQGNFVPEDDWEGCRKTYWLDEGEDDPGEEYPGSNSVLLIHW
jgi:hypothetical protein